MSGKLMRSILDVCGWFIRFLQRGAKRQILDQRGTVAVSLAVAALPLALTVATAVDFASIAAARAALQRAVDNAALSGAAAYIAYTPNDALNAVARSVAASAFCNATTALPNGFAISASSDSTPCGAAQGAVVSAFIAGYQTGKPGVATGSGCSATQTVVSGYTCGFAVTVTTRATTSTTFAGLLGASNTVAATATAVNPFINLADALSASLKAFAWNANSLWVYPLLLNAEGQPDFSTNNGALPDTSSCTGDPTQTWCGSYSMLASTKYQSCTDAKPCTVNGTKFAGSGGVVQNIHASSAVVTATTPLGIAFQSAAGGNGNPESGVAYNKYGVQKSKYKSGCTYPNTILYNTIPQTYDSLSQPIYVSTKKDAQGNIIKDSSGNAIQYWLYPTHWFYSSYLANSLPPSQLVIDVQANSNFNLDTNKPYNIQVIKPMQVAGSTITQVQPCPDDQATPVPVPPEYITTTYPTSGKTNCSLYIVKDPASLTPDPSYNGGCFSPATTPGQQYSVLSCQNYGKSTYALFWNDMGGADKDDKDYGNGTLVINCAATPKILLIN